MATMMEAFGPGLDSREPDMASWAATPVASDWLRDRPVLVATDGTPASASAVRVAAALAATCGAEPHGFRVLDPLMCALGGDVMVPLPLLEEASTPGRVRAELEQAIVGAGEWPFRVDVGAPAPLIRREAARLDAALIVLGLRRHGLFERIARDETALQVMRGAPCPVLAVRASLNAQPTRVVVGVDFSRASVRATRIALDLVAPGGTVILAYVDAAGSAAGERSEGEGIVHTLGMQSAFSRVTREAARRPDVTLEVAVLEPASGPSKVASELLSLASRAHADLVAVGSHQHGRLERWLLGSVTQALVRDGGCSLLIVPPREDALPPR